MSILVTKHTALITKYYLIVTSCLMIFFVTASAARTVDNQSAILQKTSTPVNSEPQSHQSDEKNETSYEFYPDEAKAVAQYNAEPTEENLEEVAKIRFLYAAALTEQFEQSGDGDAKRLTKALSYATSAAELAPHNAYYMFLPAYIYSLSAQSSSFAAVMAEEFAQKALDINPKYLESRALLANVYLWTYRYDNAIDHYEKLLLESPEYIRADTLFCLYHAYTKDDQKVRGEAFLNLLANYHPNLPIIRLVMAGIQKEQGKTEESKILLQSLISSTQQELEIHEAAQNALQGWFSAEAKQ